MEQFTPGDWRLSNDNEDGSDTMEIGVNGQAICAVYGSDDLDCVEFETAQDKAKCMVQALANARLISAAPNLFAAVKKLLEILSVTDFNMLHPAVINAKNTLASITSDTQLSINN